MTIERDFSSSSAGTSSLGHALELLDDHLDRLVDALDVDARLREERAGVGVGVVRAVDVVGEAAALAHLEEEARRHAGAEHGREHLERVAVGVLDRIARDAEDDVRLVGVLVVDGDARPGGPVELGGGGLPVAVRLQVAEQLLEHRDRGPSPTMPLTPTTMRSGVYHSST